MSAFVASVPSDAAGPREGDQPRWLDSEVQPLAPDQYAFPNCRLGITAWQSEMSPTEGFDIVSNLNAGWYLDFATQSPPPGPAGAEYAFMVRLGQDRQGSDVCGPDYGYYVNPPLSPAGLGARVDANPGALWIVGNEPDRPTVQDDMCPQQYAEAYHDVYYYIKQRDPSAQVAVAGLVEVTRARLQYLDIVWDTYVDKYREATPVDVWTMHIYTLSETGEGDAHLALGTDPGLAILQNFDCPDPNAYPDSFPPSYCHAHHDLFHWFTIQVIQMRQWMTQHGQRNRPLLLTEFGILKPYHFYGICSAESCPAGDIDGCFCDETKRTFHPHRVAGFITTTFEYLFTAADPQLGYPPDDDRLIQQWLWYRLATENFDDVAHASNLSNREGWPAPSLTPQGQAWQDYVQAIPPVVNLLPVRVPTAYGDIPDGTASVSVTLSAEVVNNGNTVVSGPVTVTFYSDAGLTTEIGSAVLTDLAGCARRAAVLTTTWSNLGAGMYPFWVKADGPDDVVESDETDNVMQGLAFVTPHRLRLPLVLRAY